MVQAKKVSGSYGHFGLVSDAEGKLLLVQRAPVVNGKPDGRWNLPGGGVDEGDVNAKRSPEAVAVREVAEETGLEVWVTDYRPVGVYATASHSDVAVTWLCRAVGGKLRETAEGVAAKHFTPSEVMELARSGDVPNGLVGGLQTSTGGVPRHIQMCLHYFVRVGPNAIFRQEATQLCLGLRIPL